MAAPPGIPDHSLLRVIGRGSYGEVWLARNVMGTHRAVKIVRRDAFDSDRPYLREFEGIRRCEPVSRAHDGLIDILHMGRSDAEGWFYYVMELADPTDPSDPTDHSTYRPATLAARLAPGKMLDITECLRIAESLAGALAFLHEQGLIHRDVKPSNVLYAGGVPKLGDIGLVAEAGSSRSFVGTEGFVPLEGPGTERADIFALGKVLYEALTGMDRSQFPLLPAEWRAAYDFEQRVELNEIVLRACEGARERRYATARELLADVALVASGRSVKKLRGMEGRLRLLKWAGAAAAVVAVAAVAVSWMGQRQAARERELRGRAEKAEASALSERYAAMLGQVQAARHDPSAGAVAKALGLAAELARLQPSETLRDEAAFLLGRSDFLPRDDLRRPGNGRGCAVHADSGLAAFVEPADGGGLTILFTPAERGAPVRRVSVPAPPQNFLWPEFSADGRRLLLVGWFGAGVVLAVADGAVLARMEPGGETTSLLRFAAPDGSRVLRRSQSGALAFYEIPGGARTVTPPVDWPVAEASAGYTLPAPSPDGKSVVLIHRGLIPVRRLRELLPLLTEPPPGQSLPGGSAALVECATGRVLWTVDGPDEQSVAWSPDGTRLALRAGREIRLHDAATGAVTAIVPQRIYNSGTRLCFAGSRDVLAFSTWSHSGWYDVVRQQFTPQFPCSPAHYGGASRLVWSVEDGSGIAAVEWRPSPVLRVRDALAAERNGLHLAISPDERWLILGNREAFRMHDLHGDAAEPEVVLAAPGAREIFFRGDGTLELHSAAGVHRAAWTGTPPAALPTAESLPLPAGQGTDFTAASRDGKITAFGGMRLALVQREGAPPRSFVTASSGNPVSVSPDGRWFALGSQHGDRVQVFDLPGGAAQPVHEQVCGTGCVPAFSPDGQWLVCSGAAANVILRAGTWQEEHRLPRRGSLMGPVHFTRDSRRMVVRPSWNTAAVVDCGTWRVRCRLQSPPEEQLGRSALSDGGRWFAAVGARQEIYIWDLHALERELEKSGLTVPPP